MGQSLKAAFSKHRWWLPNLTVWVAVACLLLQFSAAAHMLLVEHVRCAEHGEWVHRGETHADGLDPHRHSGDSGVITMSQRRDGNDHEHDHCLACAERREQALWASAVHILRAPASGLSLDPRTREQPIASEKDYRRAPKTSPPA